MPRAGALNKRVTFQVESVTDDGGGGGALSWTDVVTVWGGFQPERGRERLQAGRLESAVAGVLRVRSSSATRALTAAHRVLIDGLAYQIRSITNPDQRNAYLEMTVERGVAT